MFTTFEKLFDKFHQTIEDDLNSKKTQYKPKLPSCCVVDLSYDQRFKEKVSKKLVII